MDSRRLGPNKFFRRWGRNVVIVFSICGFDIFLKGGGLCLQIITKFPNLTLSTVAFSFCDAEGVKYIFSSSWVTSVICPKLDAVPQTSLLSSFCFFRGGSFMFPNFFWDGFVGFGTFLSSSFFLLLVEAAFKEEALCFQSGRPWRREVLNFPQHDTFPSSFYGVRSLQKKKLPLPVQHLVSQSVPFCSFQWLRLWGPYALF